MSRALVATSTETDAVYFRQYDLDEYDFVKFDVHFHCGLLTTLNLHTQTNSYLASLKHCEKSG